MLNTRKIFLILTVILTISLFGCSNTENASDKTGGTSTPGKTAAFPMIVTDSYGRQVKIDSEPQRIISVAPNITEIIFALGRGDRLIGRSEYCDYPEEAKKITPVGSLREPNIEKIVELKPDIVIGSTHFSKEMVQKMEGYGIKVVAFYGEESFDGVYDTITKVGKVLNVQENAEKQISLMKTKVQDVLDKVKDRPQPKVYYVVSYGKMGDFTAGKDTFVGQAIEMAGGKNVADDVKGWSYSLEKLVEKKPDIIICPKYYDTKKGIESTNGYKDLDAVKNGRLYEIDNNMLDRQGTRLADGFAALAKIIHPEAFK